MRKLDMQPNLTALALNSVERPNLKYVSKSFHSRGAAHAALVPYARAVDPQLHVEDCIEDRREVVRVMLGITMEEYHQLALNS